MSFLAFLAGVLTIINPCVLPIMPIVTASALAQSRMAPVALIAGVTVSFTTVGFALLYFGAALGGGSALQTAAAIVLLLSGFVIVTPRLQHALANLASPLVNRAGASLHTAASGGLRGQFLVGGLLGAVWTPCVGPTLGAAISAAATGENVYAAWGAFMYFSAGVFISLTAAAYLLRGVFATHRRIFMKLSTYSRSIFGSALIIIGILIITGIDSKIEALFVEWMPAWISRLSVKF